MELNIISIIMIGLLAIIVWCLIGFISFMVTMHLDPLETFDDGDYYGLIMFVGFGVVSLIATIMTVVITKLDNLVRPRIIKIMNQHIENINEKKGK